MTDKPSSPSVEQVVAMLRKESDAAKEAAAGQRSEPEFARAFSLLAERMDCAIALIQSLSQSAWVPVNQAAIPAGDYWIAMKGKPASYEAHFVNGRWSWDGCSINQNTITHIMKRTPPPLPPLPASTEQNNEA